MFFYHLSKISLVNSSIQHYIQDLISGKLMKFHFIKQTDFGHNISPNLTKLPFLPFLFDKIYFSILQKLILNYVFIFILNSFFLNFQVCPFLGQFFLGVDHLIQNCNIWINFLFQKNDCFFRNKIFHSKIGKKTNITDSDEIMSQFISRM